jgi:spore coat polysaccharide biosynthesis protein SpsF (cytidylyltransferase family)
MATAIVQVRMSSRRLPGKVIKPVVLTLSEKRVQASDQPDCFGIKQIRMKFQSIKKQTVG